MFPKQILNGLGEIGGFGPYIPAEYGGAGLDQISYGLIMQELERCDSGLRSTASVQSSLVMYPIWQWGSEEQKMKFLLSLPLFKSWSKRRVVDTSFTLTVQEYPRGATIFAQNTPSKQLFFIKSGKIVLHHRLRPTLPGESFAAGPSCEHSQAAGGTRF